MRTASHLADRLHFGQHASPYQRRRFLDWTVCRLSSNSSVSLGSDETKPGCRVDLAHRLFGFTIVQAWQYYTRFPKDSVIIKSKVSVLIFFVLKPAKITMPLGGLCLVCAGIMIYYLISILMAYSILDLLHFVFTISLVHTLFISNLESEASVKSFWYVVKLVDRQNICIDCHPVGV